MVDGEILSTWDSFYPTHKILTSYSPVNTGYFLHNTPENFLLNSASPFAYKMWNEEYRWYVYCVWNGNPLCSTPRNLLDVILTYPEKSSYRMSLRFSWELTNSKTANGFSFRISFSNTDTKNAHWTHVYMYTLRPHGQGFLLLAYMPICLGFLWKLTSSGLSECVGGRISTSILPGAASPTGITVQASSLFYSHKLDPNKDRSWVYWFQSGQPLFE